MPIDELNAVLAVFGVAPVGRRRRAGRAVTTHAAGPPTGDDRPDADAPDPPTLPWGDVEFEAVHRKVTPGLQRHVRKFGLGNEDVDDITNESWLLLVAWCLSPDPPDRPIPYLYGIAGNLSRKRLREIRRAGHVPLKPDEHAVPAPDQTDSVDHERTLGQELDVAGVPDRQREAVELVDYQGFTYEEVAAAMGVSVNTLKTHLRRGRARLPRRRDQGEADHTQEEEG